MSRQGVLVQPYRRLSQEQVESIHRASLSILSDPGILCFNRDAVDLFGERGAEVTSVDQGAHACWLLRLPEKLMDEALSSAPGVVKLGARDPENCLVLDGAEPRVHFASGSEANNWLEVDTEVFLSQAAPERSVSLPVFRTDKGSVVRLGQAAHLCEHLDSWDSFLRTVNIQDEGINDDNKDVNKFFASLNNTTKHVMSGLTELSQLGNVVRMAEIIAGGADRLSDNPIVSFITCVVKSPLQLVDDTTQKAIEVAKRRLPLVMSSSPQGGSTAPITEAGMVAQINAEIIVGVALSQLVNKGTPVLYGSVPVRARMDDLNDSYGVPEFSQYNIDCVDMARYYGLPSYSTAGVSDVAVPGIQASVERLFSHILVALSGAQYVHYAFGLLERTNTFCPVQAILDDAHIGMLKRFLSEPAVNQETISQSLEQVRRVMATPQKLYVRYVRSALRTGAIAPPYPYESRGTTDETLLRAAEKMTEIMQLPRSTIEPDKVDEVFARVPGLLPALRG